MKRTFLSALVAGVAIFGTAFAADAPAASQNEQMSDLDQLIKQFKDARDVASMRAYEAGSQADQFLGKSWTDYQQAIRKQEMLNQQVKDLDEKIAELEQQKAAMIKK